MKNYYDILEVSKNASDDIIKKVFKIQVKKYHPDTVEEEKKTEAEEKIKELNEAYEILSSPEKRKNYDEELISELSNTDEVAKLKAENDFLREKLEERNKILNDLINISSPTDYAYSNSPEGQNNLTDESEEKLNNEEYIKSLNFKYTLIDLTFKIVVTIIIIGVGIYAINLITGINILSLIFGK